MNYDIQEKKSKHGVNSDIVRQMDIMVQNNNQKLRSKNNCFRV